MKFIFRPNDAATTTGQLGGKAGALTKLSAAFRIPAWFVLLPDAFDASLSEAEREQLGCAQNPEQYRPILEKLRPSAKVRIALTQALTELCPDDEWVAVRSSAADEDSDRVSGAGQLDSFLFVRPEDVIEKVTDVWLSGFSSRALKYRRHHGLSLALNPPAVLIQRMVNSEVAGVAFSNDPVTGQSGVAVVSAVFGLGTALMSGASDADTFRVNCEGKIIQREIFRKSVYHRFDADVGRGVKSVGVSAAESNKSTLDDDQVRAVASLVRQTTKHLGRPQDIEWAYEKGCLYLLQSRPITSSIQMLCPDGKLCIWDNSNIAESYSGVTTPLTFSFARQAYTEVYRQFCRILAVPKSTIAAHDETFRNMLGFICGRIYYNLMSWYRVLAMLPGFTVNRPFMEQMMGVKEGLPEEIIAELGHSEWGDRARDTINLVVMISALIRNYFLLPRRTSKFYLRLRIALARPRLALEKMSFEELVAYYHRLERQLLTRWDAPLVNDFFTMIFFGVLRKLTHRWFGDIAGTLQNNLLRDEGGLISADLAARIEKMAHIAHRHQDFVSLLCNDSLDAILQKIAQLPQFKSHYEQYIEEFGDRCLDELKLESFTLHDDPLLFLRSVGRLAQSSSHQRSSSAELATSPRTQAERQVAEILRHYPLRRLLLTWVLRQARARLRDRENLRFERTRVFGRVRRIFVELGRRLHAASQLIDPRDIFYLEVTEILGFVEGTATSTDLKSLVALRKEEFRRYRDMEPPPDRFETRGIVYLDNLFRNPSAPSVAIGTDQRKGTGCCPGIIRGHVRIVADPGRTVIQHGEILVAERTDPGWIMLFPFASGLLVERGNLLSHSAIIARELGLPTIVSINGVTRWLKDGDLVELDGGTGIVRKVEHPPGRLDETARVIDSVQRNSLSILRE